MQEKPSLSQEEIEARVKRRAERIKKKEKSKEKRLADGQQTLAQAFRRDSERRAMEAGDPFDLLPPEVAHHILAFLPPREALRVSTVCRSWNCLIRSAGFLEPARLVGALRAGQSQQLTSVQQWAQSRGLSDLRSLLEYLAWESALQGDPCPEELARMLRDAACHGTGSAGLADVWELLGTDDSGALETFRTHQDWGEALEAVAAALVSCHVRKEASLAAVA